ncbi:MAG TPA: D-alanyl-D-alanine carboxypeptidase family protein [Dongiaceae bacterium]|nr:D-alanyl-D-alanine carboxypeptidase family protein [Dongiaceae bacterium]
MRKAIFAFVLGLCTLVAALSGGAQTTRADAVKPARLVVDAETGKVLVADRANLPWYPASLTKLMTAYITFSEVAAGRLSFTDTITVSAEAAAQPPTKFGLKTGQKITVQQAVTAMLVTSANDAAYALAERIGGSASAFVGRMNATAQNLGMIGTRFQNPNGLPDNAQVSTARDMAVLAIAIIHSFPDRYPVFSLRQASIAGRSLPTVNSLLGAYPGADGMKTGFTCGSGYNMIGSAVRDGQRLVAVVLGAHDRGQRSVLMRGLLDSGFKGGETVPNTISNIAMVPAGLGSAVPPTVLKGSDCSASDGTDAENDGAPARLPGWGIIFGSYPNPDVARQAIGASQLKLKGGVSGGRPAVVKRQFEGVTRYAALLVGLSSNDAGEACRMLWHRAQYCLALNPTVLNDPRALWR